MSFGEDETDEEDIHGLLCGGELDDLRDSVDYIVMSLRSYYIIQLPPADGGNMPGGRSRM